MALRKLCCGIDSFRAADSSETKLNNGQVRVDRKGLEDFRRSAVQKGMCINEVFEVQKIVKRLASPSKQEGLQSIRHNQESYADNSSPAKQGLRQAVTEAHQFKCAVCGLKISSPDSLIWEVEAAHIVPHRSLGRDDICNGIALCHLHHWAFDVGWFALLDDYKIQACALVSSLPLKCGRMQSYELFQALKQRGARIALPSRTEIHPHPIAMRWHRENVFYRVK
jgi:predicted restriction endonuclease